MCATCLAVVVLLLLPAYVRIFLLYVVYSTTVVLLVCTCVQLYLCATRSVIFTTYVRTRSLYLLLSREFLFYRVEVGKIFF